MAGEHGSEADAAFPDGPAPAVSRGRAKNPWHPSDRKLRLFACAVAWHGREATSDHFKANVLEAYDAVEHGHPHPLWKHEAAALVALELDLFRLNGRDPLFAALIRDIFGTPHRSTVRVGADAEADEGPHDVAGQVVRQARPDVLIWREGWLTPTARSIAQAAYDRRDFSDLPILADALTDAGCDSADLLDHLRGPGPHARGCWCLDLILSKE